MQHTRFVLLLVVAGLLPGGVTCTYFSGLWLCIFSLAVKELRHCSIA
uniref:Uncharacterized protein n=1 Tax=Arundo donax TaxID=35708 RepID=A0A0A8YY28_ARUDO